MNKILFIIILFSSTKLDAQQINIKTNILSVLFGVPSLSLEAQVFSKASLSIGYYHGQYQFFDLINVRGINLIFRQYLARKKEQGSLKGGHIDLGLNGQMEFEQVNSSRNKTLGCITVLGYQNTLFKPRIIFDVGIGAAWTIGGEEPIYQNLLYPRVNISIGYKLKK